MEPKLKLPILYQSHNFVVVNKPFDVRINSDDPSDKNTVDHLMQRLHPSLYDENLVHGFRCHTTGIYFALSPLNL